MKVVVFQWPWGAWARHRVPRADRPRKRVMLVVTAVSSRNTNFAIFQLGCRSFQLRRACCTSSRCCSLACSVFFKAQPPLIQLVPQRRDLDLYALILQAFTQLRQRQIGRASWREALTNSE